MHPSTKIAKFTFGVTALILLGLSLVMYRQLQDLKNTYNQINHNHVVKLKLQQTLAYAKDAETAQRGYLLSRDSFFLQPYFFAHENIDALLQQIRTLTNDNAEQQKNLNVLQSLMDVRFKTFNNVINQYYLPTNNDNTRKLFLLKGKESMDAIAARIEAMNHIESQLLQQREKAKDKHAFLTPLFALLLIFSTLIVLVFSYGKIIEELNISTDYLRQMRVLNEELQQKNKELEQTNKDLDSFNYLTSHDLKEPLRKIIIYSNLLLESEPQNISQKGKQHLERISKAAGRMKQLLNDLLSYSLITHAPRKWQTVDLNAVVQEAVDNLKEQVEETNAVVVYQLLPAIEGDAFQLGQLFENLLSNSLKYRLPDTAPQVHITSHLVKRDFLNGLFEATAAHYYCISFADNGLGFDQQSAAKIFEPFQRLHVQKEFSGTGIGLTICQKVVQNHNGFIDVTSAPNQGTQFDIYMPVPRDVDNS